VASEALLPMTLVTDVAMLSHSWTTNWRVVTELTLDIAASPLVIVAREPKRARRALNVNALTSKLVTFIRRRVV
jgi:hypothetical protein